MRKILGLLVGIIIFLGGIWYVSEFDLVKHNSDIIENQSTEVELVIDFGDLIATYSAEIENEVSVLNLLNQLASSDHKIEIKDYDFGSLVIGIDGRQNSVDKAWIYYVNGNSGEVGANEKMVRNGDLVEWKYIKPVF